MRWALLAITLGLLIPSMGYAQKKLSVPEDAKFVVQIDVSAFRNTRLGARLLEVTQQLAQQELGGDARDFMPKITEALGFNPLEEVKTLTVIGSDFESPEESLRLALQLGKTTGNLEGLVMAAPGYRSQQYEGQTIHSAREDDMEAHATIYTDAAGDKTILAAASFADLKAMLTAMGSEGNFRTRREVSWSVPSGTFAHLQILEFPEEVYQHDPPSNLIRMIHDLSLTLSEAKDNFVLDLVFSTQDEQRAEQFQQLAQGAKALVGLFEEEIKEDEDARMLLGLLDEVEVVRDNLSISVRIAVPEAMVLKFLREEADLPL